MGTLTVGGNNIDFPGIIQNCIIESTYFGTKPTKSCDQQRKDTWDLINSPDLVNDIDHLIQKAVSRGRSGTIGDGFRLYLLGYPEFFNPTDPYCDDVTFARTANPKDDGEPHIKLTTALRQDFNDMSDALNAGIIDAVARNMDQGVKFIDIQANGVLDGHRYCEPNVHEPDQTNPHLWFFHYPYNIQSSIDDSISTNANSSFNKANQGLSMEQINAKYPNSSALEDAIYDGMDQNQLSSGHNATSTYDMWRDFIGPRAKVLHPQPSFHDHIKGLVLAQYATDIMVNTLSVSSSQATPQSTITSQAGTQSAPQSTPTSQPPPQSTPQPAPASGPSIDGPKCIGVGSQHYIPRDKMSQNTKDFCSQAAKQGTQDPGTGGLSRIFNKGDKGEDTPDELSVAMDWPPGMHFKLDEAECNKYMSVLIDGCDVNSPTNPLNFKAGGEIIVTSPEGKVSYKISAKTGRPPTPQSLIAVCAMWYKFPAPYNYFRVEGAGWEGDNFGHDLWEQLNGCTQTNWVFTYNEHNQLEWTASGHVPFGKKGCVERAISSAGGPDTACSGGGTGL